jgi:thiamine phosphate synthase YjbQ (UPF0047 family)
VSAGDDAAAEVLWRAAYAALAAVEDPDPSLVRDIAAELAELLERRAAAEHDEGQKIEAQTWRAQADVLKH